MAVKIFCNACQNFIKDATKNDLRTMTGEEICVSCETKVKSAFDEAEKIARRGIAQIERQRDTIKAELERLKKKVIKSNEQAR